MQILKYSLEIKKGILTENVKHLEIYKESPKFYFVLNNHPNKIHKEDDINILSFWEQNRTTDTLSAWIYLESEELIPEFRENILNRFKIILIEDMGKIQLNLNVFKEV